MVIWSFVDFDFYFGYHSRAIDSLPGLCLDRPLCLPFLVMETAHDENYRIPYYYLSPLYGSNLLGRKTRTPQLRCHCGTFYGVLPTSIISRRAKRVIWRPCLCFTMRRWASSVLVSWVRSGKSILVHSFIIIATMLGWKWPVIVIWSGVILFKSTVRHFQDSHRRYLSKILVIKAAINSRELCIRRNKRSGKMQQGKRFAL